MQFLFMRVFQRKLNEQKNKNGIPPISIKIIIQAVFANSRFFFVDCIACITNIIASYDIDVFLYYSKSCNLQAINQNLTSFNSVMIYCKITMKL